MHFLADGWLMLVPKKKGEAAFNQSGPRHGTWCQGSFFPVHHQIDQSKQLAWQCYHPH